MRPLVPSKGVGNIASGHANNQIVETRTEGGSGKVVAAAGKVVTTIAICVILPPVAVAIGALGVWEISNEIMYFCRTHKNHATALIQSVKRCFVGRRAKESAQPSYTFAKVGKVTVVGVMCAVVYFCVSWILPVFVYVGVTVLWDYATGQRRVPGVQQKAKPRVPGIEVTEQACQPARIPVDADMDAELAILGEELNLTNGDSSTRPIIVEMPGDDERDPGVTMFMDGVSRHTDRWVPASGVPSKIRPRGSDEEMAEILRDLPDINVSDIDLEKLKQPMAVTRWALQHEEISQLLITAIAAHGGGRGGDGSPSTFIEVSSVNSAMGEDPIRQVGSGG
ncbi:MAG: hypothetical protein ACTJLK_02380 [Anaplasma sp.]